MRVRGDDQQFESEERTIEVEQLKGSFIEQGDQRAQIDERPDKTKEVEEAKKRSGGAL